MRATSPVKQILDLNGVVVSEVSLFETEIVIKLNSPGPSSVVRGASTRHTFATTCERSTHAGGTWTLEFARSGSFVN